MKKLFLSIILSIITITNISALRFEDLKENPKDRLTIAQCIESHHTYWLKQIFIYGPSVKEAYNETLDAGDFFTVSFDRFNELNINDFGEESAEFLKNFVIEAVQHYKFIYFTVENVEFFATKNAGVYTILYSVEREEEDNGRKGN